MEAGECSNKSWNVPNKPASWCFIDDASCDTLFAGRAARRGAGALVSGDATARRARRSVEQGPHLGMRPWSRSWRVVLMPIHARLPGQIPEGPSSAGRRALLGMRPRRRAEQPTVMRGILDAFVQRLRAGGRCDINNA